MKKIISLFLSALLVTGLVPTYAESLKDTDIIGQIEFTAPNKINLSEEETALTVGLSEIESIKTGDGEPDMNFENSAPELFDFLSDAEERSERTLLITFKEELSVSGIRLYDSDGSVSGGVIKGSTDGEHFFEIGRLNIGASKIHTTDFGFNIKLRCLAVITEGEGKLMMSELHVIKGREEYENEDEDTLSDAAYYINTASSWKVTSDTEFSKNPASLMFDGNKETFWHSDYDEKTVESKKSLPHTVTVDFNEEKIISGLRYTARNGGSRVTYAKAWASSDGKNFYLVGSGIFSYQNNDDKVIDFGENISVRAIKFVSVNTEGNTYSTGAEIEFKKPNMAYGLSQFADEMPKGMMKDISVTAKGEENASHLTIPKTAKSLTRWEFT